MKRNLLSVLLALLLICSGTPVTTTNRVVAQKENSPKHLETSSSTDEDARRHENFKPARELLLRKGVPFEPNLLLTSNWREKISPKLAQMSEIYEVRQLSGKVKGVQIADILYMPEKVEITGDTVFLAKQIIFEGRHAVLKGNYHIYFFPIDQNGVLGSKLDDAMKKQKAVFSKASFKNSSPLEQFVPQLLQEDWSLTIDTSGLGRKEWLEKQKQEQAQQYTKTSSLITRDTSGVPGSTGSTGGIGDIGDSGVPSPARSGDNGICGSPDGLLGFPGRPGGTGGVGKIGGEGGGGHDAMPQFNDIRNGTGNYTFLAKGGDGGEGGEGGQGGYGGRGAQGGDGGNGADCPCNEGGAGNGGNGGDGGKGGKGGKGGMGGIGGLPGNGADITVRYTSGNVSIAYSVDGGYGGTGGRQGNSGISGTNGFGGDWGRKASTFNCPSSKPRNGQPGLELGGLGNGELGDPGESRTSIKGRDGVFTPIPVGGGGGEECLTGSLSEESPTDESTNNLAPEPCGSSCNGLCQQNGGFCDQGGQCVGGSPSPIVIDISGNGFDLTNATSGVLFDIDVDNIREQVSWTAADTDDAWLALDRNANGTIDSGRELFGNFTPQPAPPQGEERNGFLALAEYDKPTRGGNGDNQITVGDAIFAQLKLWQDHNHNGISEQEEMQRLSDSPIRVIELRYHKSRRTDEHGNSFRYRAKVKDAQGAQIGRWAWDVFLTITQ